MKDNIISFHAGERSLKTEKDLTLEKEAALRACKRVMTGTVVLVLILILGLAIMTPMCLRALELEDGPSRTGTVQEDGQVRYIKNTQILVSLEELEAQNYGLQPGDKVVVYFDPVTDEVTSGYPYVLFEHHTNMRLGIMLGFVVLMVVVVLVYALVICRCTPFGSAWYVYRSKRKAQETQEIPLRARIVIWAVSTAIAIALCWPQIQNIWDNVQQMQRIKGVQELIQSGQAAADAAADMAGALETVGQSIDTGDALENAENAVDLIGEILKDFEND